MRKLYEPGTYVLGSKRVQGDVGQDGKRGPSYWEMGKVAGHVLHFAGFLAARRCKGNKRLAMPGDITPVPLYRGVSARMANEIRADHRRKEAGKQIFPGPRKKPN